MIQTTLIIFVLFTTTFANLIIKDNSTNSTEKIIKYNVKIKVKPTHKPKIAGKPITPKQENKTTTTTESQKSIIPTKICEEINDETRKQCMNYFNVYMRAMAPTMHSFGSAHKNCIYYTDVDFNKFITSQSWPERFPNKPKLNGGKQ